VKSPLLVLSEKLWGDDTNQLVAAVLHVLTRNGSAVLVEGVAQAEPPAELQAKLQAKKAINS
jgi:hypothetical protein